MHTVQHWATLQFNESSRPAKDGVRLLNSHRGHEQQMSGKRGQRLAQEAIRRHLRVRRFNMPCWRHSQQASSSLSLLEFNDTLTVDLILRRQLLHCLSNECCLQHFDPSSSGKPPKQFKLQHLSTGPTQVKHPSRDFKAGVESGQGRCVQNTSQHHHQRTAQQLEITPDLWRAQRRDNSADVNHPGGVPNISTDQRYRPTVVTFNRGSA